MSSESTPPSGSATRGRSEGTPHGDTETRASSGNRRAWLTATVIAAALTLLLETGRRHYAAHTLGARIVGALFGAALLTLVLRGFIYVLVPAWRGSRRRSGSTPKDRGGRGLSARRPWGAGYAFGALIAVFLGLAAIGFVLQESDVVRLPLGVGTLIVEGLFLLALVPLRRRGRIRASDIGLRSVSGPRAVGLVIAGSFAGGILTGIYVSAVRPAHAKGSLAGLGHHSALTIAVACFASVVAAPFAEEIFFRGLLYGGLRNRLPVLPAALIVAVIFGLGHTQYPLLVRPEMAIFGFVACLLYERSRSLLPGMGLHSLHNATAITLVLGGPVGIVLAAYAFIGLLVCAPAGYRAVRRTGNRFPAAGARA